MRQRVYNLVVPGWIRRRIYEANAREYRTTALARIAEREEHDRGMSLSPIYIRHLRVVLDRDALFRSLPSDAVVAQVGFGDGESARRILHIARPSVLYLCESCSEGAGPGHVEVLRAKFGEHVTAGRMQIRPGPACAGLSSLPAGSLDWVYLDRACAGRDLAQTLAACRSQLRTMGIIAGGDYGATPHVEDDEYAVVKAVHEFCKTFGWEMILLTHEFHRRLHYAVRQIASRDVSE